MTLHGRCTRARIGSRRRGPARREGGHPHKDDQDDDAQPQVFVKSPHDDLDLAMGVGHGTAQAIAGALALCQPSQRHRKASLHTDCARAIRATWCADAAAADGKRVADG
ncbi:MAG: hypothetical protein KGK06_06420, partial [Xanthomonadaceae bacterium]|nr:hypothetical protein [Xanthomonadaceae bacterium]